MSGLLDVATTVTCSHGGVATPVTGNARVLVDGTPTVVLSTTYAIVGCPFVRPSAGASPCASGRWITGSVRVRSLGQPLVLQGEHSVCVPNGTPLVSAGSRFRVLAT